VHVSRSSGMSSLQTRMRVVSTCIALATTKKSQLSISDYYAKMCQYADDLAASDTPLRDDELVAYVLVGLNEDFNLIFTAMVVRVDPIIPSELYAQLLSFKHHANLLAHNSSGSSSTMAMS
jgi:flagellar basal body rod protein FlgC